MIDIHSHILPSIDDGAKTVEDSLAMARAAVADGIHTIIATPHHNNGRYSNEAQFIKEQTAELNEHINNANIPLTILPGQEPRIYGEMVEDLQHHVALPLNDTQYVFVEFPSDHVPRYSGQLLFDIQVAGYQPIIVHPERNQDLMKHPDRLHKYVERGALTQVTAASVCGKFGKKIKKFTNQLIEANLTHFVANDAHNTTTRGFCLQQAYGEIDAEFGQAKTFMLQENAELLTQGEHVIIDPPSPVKKQKILGLF
ncbi:tyrosine-protein phosphatase [Pontibacillus litoralis]|uniref:Tyrosine-protein phosphatase n=1 Tax=Pontibacillus litoralis JSM 072002 TaxID=1385512 RepID=A0A0A5G5D5_9BACI|nr:CpsB/CapC family capsule biosynthesis tyrosine phosphatase [Pontibacillus litoralis]KGX86373.1 tyrosine protein phosphatase [Pontibacillus litoralis JSM 072002]